MRIEDVQPVHVAGYIEQLQATRKAPTVKQHLACIRMLFDWLVTGQVLPLNPAHAVRGPRHSVIKGATTVMSSHEKFLNLVIKFADSLIELAQLGHQAFGC